MPQLVSGRTDANAEIPLRVDADGNLGTLGGAEAGAVDDAAYDDPTGAADGTVVALLKGCYVKLSEIAENTLPL